ncbi:hypothetical protein DFH09DRAFT_934890, partial [Mycena vulgaris]
MDPFPRTSTRAQRTTPARPTSPLPKKFRRGLYPVEAFVTLAQIKDHLALLDGFAELRAEVEATPEERFPFLSSTPDQRWAGFVGLLVEWWVGFIAASWFWLVFPPLDVLMVWHAYMLNPGWYSEDTNRIEALKGLQDAGIAFGGALGRGLQNLVVSEPSKGRVDHWTKMTGTPFDPFESAKWTVSREIACPRCRTVADAPYSTETETGYLQKDFAIRCTKCAFRITRETLAVRKLANNLAMVSMTNDSGLLAYRNTVHGDQTSGSRACAEPQTIKKTMLSADSLKWPNAWISDEAYADFVLEEANYKPETLKRRLSRNMHNQGGRLLLGRIMSAYVDDKMFSVELVGAVLRKGSFVTKMNGLGWTKAEYFENVDNEVVLQHANARYHVLLDLMWEFPKSFFVPTLDIDLVWHTHQLMTTSSLPQYARDTSTHMDRYIDHNDKVEESRLANSFDDTCQKWKSKYGLDY